MSADKPVIALVKIDRAPPKGAPPRPPVWAPALAVPVPHRAEGVEPEYLGTD